MTTRYCTRADVSRRLPVGSVTSSSGVVAESSIGENTFTYDGHGLETGDPVNVRAIEGGTLPAPLVDGQRYFAIRESNSVFGLSATAGGPAIDITSSAVSMLITREPDIEEVIEFYSAWADTSLPAHLVPLDTPIHPFVKGIVADLAAKRILNGIGKESAVITAAEVEAKAQLERFASGLPLRGSPVTASANRAVTNTIATSSADPRGWGSRRLP